jgi:hypothetical protein
MAKLRSFALGMGLLLALALLAEGGDDEQQPKRKRRGQAPAAEPTRPLLPPDVQDKLDLSAEQKEQLAKLQKETQEKLLALLNDDQKKKLRELLPPSAPAAGRRPGAGQGDMRGVVERLKAPLLAADRQEKLGLSGEQKEKVAKLQADFEEKTKEGRARLVELVGKVRQGDANVRRELREQVGDQQRLRQDYEGKVRVVLTDEQKKKLDELKQEDPNPAPRRPGARTATPAPEKKPDDKPAEKKPDPKPADKKPDDKPADKNVTDKPKDK